MCWVWGTTNKREVVPPLRPAFQWRKQIITAHFGKNLNGNKEWALIDGNGQSRGTLCLCALL